MEVTRIIRQPVAEVFDFFADVENNPRWQKGMRSCQWTSGDRIDVGSTYEQVARFMGRDIVSSFVVVEFEQDRRIHFETVESTFPIQVKRSVETISADTCRVTAVITGGPQGRLAKLFEPLFASKALKSVEQDYDRLVALLEADSIS